MASSVQSATSRICHQLAVQAAEAAARKRSFGQLCCIHMSALASERSAPPTSFSSGTSSAMLNTARPPFLVTARDSFAQYDIVGEIGVVSAADGEAALLPVACYAVL